MKCPNPIVVRDKKNKSYYAPCGKCPVCLTNRREDWTIRMIEESKNHLYSVFITLTYDEENIKFNDLGFARVVKEDLQKFIKRLRSKIQHEIKYFAISEYGPATHRPHYHIIAFGLGVHHTSVIERSWDLGIVTVDKLNIRRISYSARYHADKGYTPRGREPTFCLMSKGLGKSYIENMRDYHEGKPETMYYQLYQFKKKMPRYYKEKLFTKEEIEQISSKISDSEDLKEEMEISRLQNQKYYFKAIIDRNKQREIRFIRSLKNNRKL